MGRVAGVLDSINITYNITKCMLGNKKSLKELEAI
jgi:hypothetical protein